MKIDGFLKVFIEDIESIAGPLCYEDEIEEGEDVVRLELEDYPNIIIEVDTLLEYMDMYCVFSYTEYTTSIREHGCDAEDVEHDIAMYYAQKDCETILKSVFPEVEIWDDDCWGCPCFDINIGLSHVSCDIKLVDKFIKALNTNAEKVVARSNEEWREKRIQEILRKSCVGTQVRLKLRNDIDYRPLNSDNVVQYVGREYVLYKNARYVAAITKEQYEFLLTIIDETELFSDFSVQLYDKTVRFITCTYWVDMCVSDYSSAARTEALFFNSNLSRILLLLSDEDRNLVGKTISDSQFSNEDMEKLFIPHIYTEGKTDCMHIKHALHLSEKYSESKWQFDDSRHDEQKGDRELLSDCRTYCKDPDATHVKIAIFDRDGSIPLKEIEDPQKGFKDWGNKVYSFALPIPQHRIKTPAISIEHYYSDQEIFREYNINGVMRRLFMGYEFDRVGRAPQIGRMRKSPNKCGPESIAIIDCDVYDPNSSSDIDYALSKSTFAEKICLKNCISAEAEGAFDLLFDKIAEIVKYDKEYGR